ncbi:MAG: response regulator [Myxococcaceae bacterium]|nr:response regulator [Myxococcaceae bacterium]
MIAFALEPLGFRCLAVNDGAEAVAQVATRAFDLVMLDQHMPRMNGIEALKQIRSLLPDMPVVMLSGSTEEQGDFEAEVREAGAACCLFKPLELQPLLSAVELHAKRGGR